jgi:hypothetical protein
MGLLALLILILLTVASPTPAAACVGKQVPAGADLDRFINSDPSGTATTFCLPATTYTVDNTLVPQNGDKIIGPTGTLISRPPAFDPEPTATIRGAAGLDQVMKPKGTFTGQWFIVEGGTFTGQSGSGSGIAGGAMTARSSLYAVVVQHNEGLGISNAHGTFDSIELTDNTNDTRALGFTASGLKAVDEVEVVRSYVHHTQGNGLWCDEFCNDMPTANGTFWVHDNLVVNNGREGVRWEKIGDGPAGEATSGEALIEGNTIQRNGLQENRAGVGIRDAQDALVRGNIFGGNAFAIRASDSGRADRPNLENIDIVNNQLNGEIIKGCELPDAIVFCSGNTR